MDLLNTISNNRLWNKHGGLAVWVGASLCLLLALSHVGWNAYSQSKIRQANYQPQAIAPVGKSNDRTYRINDIVAANLFGDPRPKVEVKKAPKTTLDLTLQGILWASDPSFARAIIVTGKKNSELYSVGESIKGAGASVKEIRDGEVLLDRNGATESLPLLKETTSGNREVISYSPLEQDHARISTASNKVASQKIEQRSPQTNAQNDAPRKLRKPDFSGLDRALEKMEEL